MYQITDYTFKKLDELNKMFKTDAFNIKVSKNKSKKIDVFINDEKVASVGAIKSNGVPYLDYPSYINTMGQKYADRRRQLYYDRHASEPMVKDGKITASWYAKYFLW